MSMLDAAGWLGGSIEALSFLRDAAWTRGIGMVFKRVAPNVSGRVNTPKIDRTPPVPSVADTDMPRRGRGRPPLLKMEPGLIDSIYEHVRSGLFYTEAAALEGISVVDINTWMTKGVRDLKNGIEDSVYADFAIAIKSAMAEAEQESLGDIRRAGKTNAFWMASAWYLERKYPDRYGKQDRTTVEMRGQLGVVSANPEGLRGLTEDDARAAATILGILGAGRESEAGTDEPANAWDGGNQGADSDPAAFVGDQ